MSRHPPVTSPAELFAAINELVELGFVFGLFASPATIDYGDGPVQRQVIYWQSPSSSLWSPISVVANELFDNPQGDIWLPVEMAAAHIGLPKEVMEEVELARTEHPEHLPRLRARLLQACGLQ
jgi:hypothetical protein